MMRKLAPLALVFALSACAAETGGAGNPTPRDEYPAGPYGVTEGDVIEPLTFARSDGAAFSFDTDIFAHPEIRVALITTTAGWCSACIAEQPKLRALYNELHDRGFTIMQAMFEDAEYQPATGDQAAAWKAQYELPFEVVTDAPFVLSEYYDESATPMMMVVDVDTMEILLITTGYNEQLIRSAIEANL